MPPPDDLALICLADHELDEVSAGRISINISPSIIIQTNIGTQLSIVALSRATVTQVMGQVNWSA